jgi:S-adenosylmethionine uptake transporter
MLYQVSFLNSPNKGSYMQRKGKFALGVIWFLMSLLASVSNDAITKHLGYRLHPAQIAFFRFFFGTLTLLPFMLWHGKKMFRTKRVSIHIIRGSLLFFGISLWTLGVTTTPLTTVTIMSFTIPIIVLVLAPIFLKEKVTIDLWLSTLVCFIGVLVVLNPTGSNFDPKSLGLLLAALAFAALDIINKKIVSHESMLAMLFYSAMITSLLCAWPAFGVWVTPTLKELGILLVLGAGANLILFFILKAFTYVAASTLSPFRYLELVLSAALGYFIFAEGLDVNTILGCSLIIPATLYVSYKRA